MVHFHGSLKEDGRSAAGVSLYHYFEDTHMPIKVLEFSVPLTVQSAWQSELCALICSVVLLNCIAQRRPLDSIVGLLRSFEHKSFDEIHAHFSSLFQSAALCI